MSAINKEAITLELKSRLGLSALVCEEIVNNIFLSIIEVTIDNEKLSLKNFGNFRINSKKARPGVNLQTNQPINIAPRKVLSFTPAKKLKLLINEAND